MCGINGIFAHHRAAAPIDRLELVRTRDYMAKRGPDGQGEWISEGRRIGLGHRRLAIIDLSDTGRQPMTSSDGRFIITFNGEIYNFRALRRELESKGRVFRSNSDTEVLLHLYADKGEMMVHDLRGMFAFAIYDTAERKLFMARDPLGIKPLYYADDGRTLRFASQVRALLAGGAIDRTPDPAGQVGFHLWGSVPEPFTMWAAIRAVPAGCTLTQSADGSARLSRYSSVAAIFAEAETEPAPQGSLAEALRPALLDSVRHHLESDVPVGAFLSAGIDSGALVGLMRDAGQAEIRTITLAFEEFRGHAEDEAPLAAEVARLYGTQHTTRLVTEAEFTADLPRIMNAMDQPSIDGLNTWFVAKAARELGLKVAVSGLGGDELLGGYPAFRDLPRWVGRVAPLSRVPLAGSLSRRMLTLAGGRLGLNPKAAGMLELGGSYAGAYLLRRGLFMPWELGQVIDADMLRSGLEQLAPLAPALSALSPCPRSAFARVATLETSLYMRNQLLRDTDWASMAHSLEVRVPLVDTTVLKSLAPHLVAPGYRLGKAELARSPRRPLPDEVVNRPKTGFGTPIASWLQRSAYARRRTGVPALAAPNCPWARRWAYQVAGAAA